MKLITDLILDEVSLVADPANPEANVALFKTGEDMDYETKMAEMADELEKAKADLAKANEDLEKMKDDKETVEKSLNSLTESVTALGFEITETGLEKAAEEVYLEIEGERIAKSTIPAPILKALEEKEEALQKAAETAAYEDLRKRATESFPNLGGTEDTRAQLLKALEVLPEGTRDEVLQVVKAADKALAKAYTEEGVAPNAESMSDPEEALNKMAHKYAKANKVTFHQGYGAVIKSAEGKALFKQIDKE